MTARFDSLRQTGVLLWQAAQIIRYCATGHLPDVVVQHGETLTIECEGNVVPAELLSLDANPDRKDRGSEVVTIGPAIGNKRVSQDIVRNCPRIRRGATGWRVNLRIEGVVGQLLATLELILALNRPGESGDFLM